MTSLNPVLKVGHQIMESILFHTDATKEEARAKALEMIKLVGIPRAEEIMECYPHELSGGMRQRIMIAMALVCNPKLLIADEPTTALDVTIQAQILDLMRKLKEEMDMSIMLITHDLASLQRWQITWLLCMPEMLWKKEKYWIFSRIRCIHIQSGC